MIDKNQTEMFRIGLTMQYIGFNQVIEWSDKKIVEGNNEYDYIEISTARNINEMISVLGKIEGVIDPAIVVYGFMSILCYHCEHYPNEYKKITRTLFGIVQEYENILTKDESAMIYYLDDACDLILQGIYGSIDTFKLELRAFLNKYRGMYKNIFL